MEQPTIDRQSMEVDIACVGFGPAMGGFLTTLSRHLVDENGQPLVESKAMPGMPLQVLCYERADDISFGVSGVVTRARGIRASFPNLKTEDIPMACEVRHEKTVYLLDPIGAALRALDAVLRPIAGRRMAIELPYTPPFLRKHGGLILSIGQFNQWVGNQLMASGTVQIWPGTPVQQALIEDHRVVGVRLADQGVERDGTPTATLMPGMDVRAALTVVGDGPVGPVGRQLDEAFGMPEDRHREHWAVGMKMVVELPEACDLPEGTVVHTFGFPEPEIFGFLYVMPGRLASLGVFVPSFLDSPVRTTYRYLQHWMRHPYLWRWLEGGTMRSWGAKTLAEYGKQGEPFLVGDGYARIGEGSGTTNVLTGSGVDEAWTSGVQLAEGVLEILRNGQPFTRENLAAAYERRRRESWIESEGRVAEHARDGFTRGFLAGLIGMGLTGLTGGR
ncbi:MAG: NAD(P)/FAD-dependent oxidoreductase, partial [Fimbriimonadales bacterium]